MARDGRERRRAIFFMYTWYVCVVCCSVCIHVHVCMCAAAMFFVKRRPEVDTGCLPPFYFLRQNRTELGADLQASRIPLTPSHTPHPPQCGVTQLLCPGFILVIDIQTQVVMLADRQELLPLTQLPAWKCYVLKQTRNPNLCSVSKVQFSFLPSLNHAVASSHRPSALHFRCVCAWVRGKRDPKRGST